MDKRLPPTVSEAEILQTAEMLLMFQKLPPMERTAFQHYIKGRLDAMAALAKSQTQPEPVLA